MGTVGFQALLLEPEQHKNNAIMQILPWRLPKQSTAWVSPDTTAIYYWPQVLASNACGGYQTLVRRYGTLIEVVGPEIYQESLRECLNVWELAKAVAT